MCPPPAERKQRAKWTVPSGFECVRAPERVSVCVRVRVRGVGWSRDGFGPNRRERDTGWTRASNGPETGKPNCRVGGWKRKEGEVEGRGARGAPSRETDRPSAERWVVSRAFLGFIFYWSSCE